MDESSKKKTGGARPGAGRKKGGRNKGPHHTGRIVVSCLEEEAERIRAMAASEGKSVSQLIVERVLK